ncbi:hypothetical protein MKX03_025778, partial [Papaver bracteatum]
IIFDKYGRPCDIGSEQFVMEIGKIVRAHCRPTIDSWTVVSEIIKDDIWNNVVVKYEVAEIYKPNILTKANVSWKNWKHQLRLVMDKYDTVDEMKINMHGRLISKREYLKDKTHRAADKKAREVVELLQSCGRKRISRTIYDLEKKSPTGEINRCVVFATTHVTKTINDLASTSASDVKIRKIKELVYANPEGQNDIDNDAISKSNLSAASNCFIKNFRGRTITLGNFNNVVAPMEHAYSVSVEEIFDRDAELYDEDGTLSDIMLGQVINWSKGNVQPYR